MIDDMRLAKIDWFPIDAGHIFIFARAIGDPNPIYSDPVYAATTPAGGIIAPPTFLEAGIHFDTAFPFRPSIGQPWLGSAAEPTGLLREALDGGTDMHAETHYAYHCPLRPGMVLRAASRHGKRWETQSARAGKLQFGEMINDYYDQSGTLVASCRTVVLGTERKVEQGSRKPRPRSDTLRLDMPAQYPAANLRAEQLEPGMRHASTVCVNLSRAQIIQYAGASGDFSPQHIDEVYNTQVAGYPSVFAHGMLTMAMTGRMLTDWLGDGTLRTFGFQFRNQVWPGDSVIAAATITSVVQDPVPLMSLDLETRNAAGELLGKGYATAALE